jgi:hypothetical protein
MEWQRRSTRIFFAGLLGGGLLALLSCARPAVVRLPSSEVGEPMVPCVPTLRAALVGAGRATVRWAVADLRERPDWRAPLADQVLLGETVEIVPGAAPRCHGPGGEWLEVRTATPYHGWIELAALQPLAVGEAGYGTGGVRLRVVSRLAGIYAEPTVTANRPLLLVSVDSELRLRREVDSRWREIELPDGRDGFVQAGDVAPLVPAVAASADCVLAHARLYDGTPYLWGGRSTLGIDCSGLVRNAFAACGVGLPRDAGPQFFTPLLENLPQFISALQPGDLLFFGQIHHGAPPSVSHVGISLGGERFLDATTYGRPMVHEDSLADPHWSAIWIGARRYPFPAVTQSGPNPP